MMNIEDMLHQAAGEPAPPTRLTADAVFDAGRDRYRRERRMHGLLLTGTMVAALGLIAGGAHIFTKGSFAPSSNDKGFNTSAAPSGPWTASPTALPTGLPSGIALPSGFPSLPVGIPSKLDCDRFSAQILATLRGSGFGKDGKAEVRCEGNKLIVTVSVVNDPYVKVNIAVEVTVPEGPISAQAKVCTLNDCTDFTGNGLVVRSFVTVDSSGYGGSQSYVSADQLRSITIGLSARL